MKVFNHCINLYMHSVLLCIIFIHIYIIHYNSYDFMHEISKIIFKDFYIIYLYFDTILRIDSRDLFYLCFIKSIIKFECLSVFSKIEYVNRHRSEKRDGRASR